MTPARAAEVLRNARAGHLELRQAEEMGADALEFQAWLFEMIGYGKVRVVSMYNHWHGEDSFLDYCGPSGRKRGRDELEIHKDRRDGGAA